MPRRLPRRPPSAPLAPSPPSVPSPLAAVRVVGIEVPTRLPLRGPHRIELLVPQGTTCLHVACIASATREVQLRMELSVPAHETTAAKIILLMLRVDDPITADVDGLRHIGRTTHQSDTWHVFQGRDK